MRGSGQVHIRVSRCGSGVGEGALLESLLDLAISLAVEMVSG